MPEDLVPDDERPTCNADLGAGGRCIRTEGYAPPCAPYRQAAHSFSGSNPDRQSVGDPGHCEDCCSLGHVVAHPELGCGDVGCNVDHGDDAVETIKARYGGALAGLARLKLPAVGDPPQDGDVWPRWWVAGHHGGSLIQLRQADGDYTPGQARALAHSLLRQADTTEAVGAVADSGNRYAPSPDESQSIDTATAKPGDQPCPRGTCEMGMCFDWHDDRGPCGGCCSCFGGCLRGGPATFWANTSPPSDPGS